MGARIGLGLKEETWKWVVEQDWKLSRKAEKGGVRICVCVCVCVFACWGRGEGRGLSMLRMDVALGIGGSEKQQGQVG